MNKKLAELVNKSIDGELTPQEESELNEMLKVGENRKYYESMTNAIKMVESNKPARQNIDIRNAVMNKLMEESSVKISNSFMEMFARFFNGSKISYGLSFALGGLLVGLILTMQPSQSSVDEMLTRGTMSNLSYGESYNVDESNINGAVQVRYSDEIVMLDIDLKTNEQTDCELNFEKSLFTLYGVKSVKSVDGGKFTSGGNSIRLQNLESNHYMVFLRSLNKVSGKVYANFYNEHINVANLTMNINY